jgi:hypothetical protein
MIDSAAFLLYGHWIKKDEHQNQNRATLFQTEEKSDLVRHEQLLEQQRLDQQNRSQDQELTLHQKINDN